MNVHGTALGRLMLRAVVNCFLIRTFPLPRSILQVNEDAIVGTHVPASAALQELGFSSTIGLRHMESLPDFTHLIIVSGGNR